MVHREGRAIRLGAVLALALLIAAAPPGPAQADDIFTVSGVAVDVTAEAAAAAREQAILQGQRKAAATLFRRLALQDDYAKIPTLTDTQLYEAVQGFEVAREKTSTVRYIGDLTVRFKPDVVRQILRANGIRYAETVSKPVVVVPVYRVGESTLLWDETNPWLAAWGAHVTKGGLVPFIVPFGDLTDIVTVSAQDAVQSNLLKLNDLAQRYGASDSIVVVAAPSPDGSGLDISATRFAGSFQDRTDVMRIGRNPGESDEEMMIRAVRTVEAQIEENWKQENVLRFGEEETISVTVPITDLGQWIAVRRKLDSLAFVRSADLTEISRTQAVVGLHFLGDIGQLKLALAQKDLALVENGGAWILRPAQAVAAPSGPGTGESAAVPGAGESAPPTSAPPDVLGVPGDAMPGEAPPEDADFGTPGAPATESGF